MKHVLQSLVLTVMLSMASGRVVGAAVTPPCVGDCHGNGATSIDSLITLVGVALGTSAPASCPLGVPEGAQINVALLIEAVNNALRGCPAARATPTLEPINTPTHTPVPTASDAQCPTGQHLACHSGSGRGGGYRRICSCVVNPPPVCSTAWGTRIQAGTSTILYDVNMVHAPDACSAHATVVSCDVAGVLSPANATGYPTCVTVSGDPDD